MLKKGGRHYLLLFFFFAKLRSFEDVFGNNFPNQKISLGHLKLGFRLE